MQVKAKELGVKDRLADLELIIWGDNLHAPLMERIVELPMDIYEGAYPLSVKLCLLSLCQESACTCSHCSGPW